MIYNITQVQDLVSEAIGGKVLLSYPEQRFSKTEPWAVISMPSNQALLRDRHGDAVASQLVYIVRIYAKGQRNLLDLCQRTAKALNPYHLHLMGTSPAYNDSTYGPFMVATFSGGLDRRGNTFA